MPTGEKALDMQFTEAVDYFRQKVNMPSAHWTAVMDEAHARSFAVAGATSDALIQDFREAVDKAIAKGTGLQEFRKDFDAIVKKHGWSHTGTANWRARIIYQTNLRSAFAAGRYAQMTEPAVLSMFPYWEYLHVNCPHPRPMHVAWSGMVLRADDPWWNTNYPPNGWNCHCIVGTVSERGLSRMGKSAPDKAPDLDWREYINRTTGVVTKYPAGVDPGFAYNPGKAWKENVKQPVKAPDVKPVGLPPPVLAPKGEITVKPDVLKVFLENPGDDSVQLGELPAVEGGKAAPVILPGAVVKAAASAGVRIGAEQAVAISMAIPEASGAAHQPRTKVVLASDLVVALKWDADAGCWMVAAIRKDTQ